MNGRKVELLAPAGNMEKFFTAMHFGADAVYMAGKEFGLRAFSGNFTLDEIAFCADYAHNLGKKVYITVNIFGKNDDLKRFVPTADNGIRQGMGGTFHQVDGLNWLMGDGVFIQFFQLWA